MFPVSREELCWEGGEQENTRSGTEDVRNRSSTELPNKRPPRTRILTISDLGLSLEAEGKLWVRMLLSCCFREGRNKKKKNNLKEKEKQVFRNLLLISVRKAKILTNPFFRLKTGDKQVHWCRCYLHSLSSPLYLAWCKIAFTKTFLIFSCCNFSLLPQFSSVQSVHSKQSFSDTRFNSASLPWLIQRSRHKLSKHCPY